MSPAPRKLDSGRPEDHLPLTNLAFHILLAIADAPKHGYGIILDVEERTGGVMRLRSGTLYTAVQRLHDEGLLGESPRPADEKSDDQRRRYYQITTLGRQVARLEADRLAAMVRTAEKRALLEPGRLP